MMRGPVDILFLGLLVFLITVSIRVQCTQPGLKVRITQPGINYAAKVAVHVLSQDLKGRTIPNQSGKSGRVSYSITGSRITGFVAPTAQVTLQAGTGATFSLQGCSASVKGRWSYKYKLGWFKFSDSGSFDVSASGLGISMTVQIGMTGGKPTIRAFNCNSHVGGLKLKLRGGLSWLYNLFSKFFINPLKKKLRDLMCTTALKAINTSGTKQLQKIKQKVTLRNILELDYSLISKPIFTSNFMESSHKGEVFYRGDYTEAPFQPGQMAVTASGQMVTIAASDYILNTMGLVLHKRKLISYRLTRNNLKPTDKYILSTRCPGKICMGSVLPKVAAKYPNSFFEISMATTQPPTATFLPNMIRGTFKGDVSYYVRNPYGAVTKLCTLSMSFTVDIAVVLDGNKLKGTVSGFKPQLSLSGQCPDDMTGPQMTKVLQMVGNTFILPNLNDLGKAGLEIPSMDNVDFKNPQLQFKTGFLQVSADLLYAGVPK